MKVGDCEVQKVYVGSCEIKKIYVGACLVYDATAVVGTAFWGITPDPDTYVMLDVRDGTPPITDARTLNLNAPDQSGIYNAFGLELAYELGEVTGEVNSRVVTAVEGEPPTQLFDSFDNDNGTPLQDHTPDIDVNGQGWVVLNGSMVLIGDACNTEAANSHASIDIGIMDVDIDEQVFIYDAWAGFSLRVQDHDNCIVAYLHVNGTMEIGEFVDGVYATLNSSTGHTVGYQQTHDVRVTQVGDDITLYFDGAELSATTTRFPGVTSIGLRSGLATAQLGGAKWLDITVHGEAEIEVPWLVHAPEATNRLLNSQAPVNQSTTALTGTHTAWLLGAGSMDLSGGLTGTVTEGSPVTGDPAGAAVTCAFTGTPDLAQIEDNLTPTYPVYTDGQIQTRDSSEIAIPIINHSDEGDYYEFDVIVTGPCNVLDIFLQFDGTDFILTDGTNEQRLPGTVGTTHRIRIDYSKELLTMTLSVDGTPHAEGAYTGTLRRDMLKCFEDSPYVGKIREVKRDGAAGSDAFITTWRTTTDNESIVLPLRSGVIYDMLVDWGDGQQDTITSEAQPETTHEYATAGDYDISITGRCDSFGFAEGGAPYKANIIGVKQFGSLKMTELRHLFYQCSNLVIETEIPLDCSDVTSVLWAFNGASSLGKLPILVDSGRIPSYASFASACGITALPEIFDASGSSNLQSAFQNTGSVSQSADLSNWLMNEGEEIKFQNTFFGCGVGPNLTLPVMDFNIGQISSSTFSQCLNIEVIDLAGLNNSLNTSLSHWCYGSTKLHTIIGIEDLDTGLVTTTDNAFRNTDLDVDVSAWDITSLTNATSMMLGSNFSQVNYDKLLLSWSQQAFQPNVTAHFGTATYQEEEAKQILLDEGWIITDGGYAVPLYAFTPDPDTAVMQDLRFGTPPITDGRTLDLNLPDQSDIYNAFGEESGYEGGIVTGVTGSRVVTSDTEVPWLVHAPAATNLTTTCRDHTDNNNSAGTSILQATGIDGTQQWIAVRDASNTVAASSIGPDIHLAGVYSWVVCVLWVEKQANTGFFSELQLTPKAYTAEASCIITMDLETGGTAIRAGQPRAQHAIIDDGDFWKVVLAVESPLNTDYRISLYPCRYNSLISDGGQSDVTLQETVVADAWQMYVGVHPDIVAALPPIYTSGQAVTRDSSEIAIPAINHSDAGDRYTFDVIVTGGPCNVLGTFLQYDGTDFILTDGTNECRVTAAIGQHSIQIDYSAAEGTMSLAVDGGTAVAGAYSGTLLVGDFTLFRDFPHVGKIRNIKRKGPEFVPRGWWDVPGHVCVGAWQAKGAASYADSLVDLTGSTNDLTLIVGPGPTWDSSTGWTFAGDSALATDAYQLTKDFSLLTRHANASATGGVTVGYRGNSQRLNTIPMITSSIPQYSHGSYFNGGSPTVPTGVMAVSRNGGYKGGVKDVVASTAALTANDLIYVGAAYSSLIHAFTGDVIAFAVYSTPLDDWSAEYLSARIQEL